MSYETFANLEKLIDEMLYNGMMNSSTSKCYKELITQLKLYFKVQFSAELNTCKDEDMSWFNTKFLTTNTTIPEFGKNL